MGVFDVNTLGRGGNGNVGKENEREEKNKQNTNFLGGFCAAGERDKAERAVGVAAVPSLMSPASVAMNPCPAGCPAIPCLCPCRAVIEVHVQFFEGFSCCLQLCNCQLSCGQRGLYLC